jgi:hypothetical protein
MSTQVPWQSFLLVGHAPLQARATHVAVPPTGSAQRVHDVPHDFGSSELTHMPEQACWSVSHVSTGASTGGVTPESSGPVSAATPRSVPRSAPASKDDGESLATSSFASAFPSTDPSLPT